MGAKQVTTGGTGHTHPSNHVDFARPPGATITVAAPRIRSVPCSHWRLGGTSGRLETGTARDGGGPPFGPVEPVGPFDGPVAPVFPVGPVGLPPFWFGSDCRWRNCLHSRADFLDIRFKAIRQGLDRQSGEGCRGSLPRPVRQLERHYVAG